MRTVLGLRMVRVHEVKDMLTCFGDDSMRPVWGHVTSGRRKFGHLPLLLFSLAAFAMSSSDPSSSQSPTEYLKTATFSRSEGLPVSPDSAVTASDLLMATYDRARLHPLAQIGDKLDYLLLDDE